MADIPTTPRCKRIRRIESELVHWITPSEYIQDQCGGKRKLEDQGFGSEGVLHVMAGTVSWNSPKIEIMRGRDDFRNLWGIWKRRFVLCEYRPSCSKRETDEFEFNSRIVHQVLKKTKTQSIKLFGDI